MPHSSICTSNYSQNLYAPQDALLSEIEATLFGCNMAMHVGPEIGKFLQLLIRLHHVKTIVEVGTLAGYSTIWMARALPEGGHIYTCNKDKGHIEMARGFFAKCEVRQRITMVEGDARETLTSLTPKAPFDMMFIDAAKIHYNEYLDWAEANVRTGGLIVADNTLLGGALNKPLPQPRIAPTTYQNMKRFNERLTDPERYFSALIPTNGGLSVAVKL